ncbi:lantibiotic dehydratase family protein [Chryseobacterium sp. MYb264]|uniref:lantibiotic dehydratase family protein n=1 Tax=Chryseobacterium sp. MYb264 TaxID=2745153 RepID=UPI002E10B53B|nr:lantibiotic dehydratase family protein [Chryseobacterium sp. MYb264]
MPTYKAFDKFIIRTPLLPFNSKSEEFTYKNNLFREGIYIASRTLYEEMLKYEENDLKNGKDRKRIENTLKKYWMRMQTRTTPFGLFSGISIGETTQDDSEITFNNKISRKARLDMAVVCRIVELLEKDPVISNEILYYPNDSMYAIDDKIRYLENKLNENRYILEVSSVDKSFYLYKILTKSKNGISKKELVEYILSLDSDLSFEDVFDFITECIESRLILSELTPSLTEPDNTLAIYKILNARVPESEITKVLETICGDIEKINASDIEESAIPLYESIIENLKSLDINFDYNKIFQVDSFTHFNTAKLSKNIINDVMDAVNFCINISPPTQSHTSITEFKTKFYERYEDREVDLIKVMDNDIGIGYPLKHDDYTNSLIKGFYLPVQNNQQSFKSWNTKYEGILLNKILHAVNRGQKEVILTKDDFDLEEGNNLHTTASCFFEILNDEHLISLNFFGDNSGAKMMSRFSHLHQDIDHLVKNISLYEEQVNNHLLNAELYYLPNPRTGNVMIRPQNMRKYEITCLSKSSQRDEYKIPISDLTIRIKNSRIVIQSKKLKKEIKVFHTNAYNYSLSDLPIFKFLGDLQYQDKLMTAFQIPDFDLDFLPRIRYKNVILSLAKWNINVQKFKKENPNLKIENVLSTFKTYYNLPDEIVQAYGDNELYIHLLQDDYSQILWDLIDKNNSFVIKEFVFDGNCNAVKDVNKNIYRNQFNLSLYKG